MKKKKNSDHFRIELNLNLNTNDDKKKPKLPNGLWQIKKGQNLVIFIQIRFHYISVFSLDK